MEPARVLRLAIPSEVFDDQDFNLIKEDLGAVARQSLMKRLLKKGDVVKVSRGLYVFGEIWRRKGLSKYTIANRLYSPSYISFESALSFHNLIPESVPTTTSACFQMKKKNFKTPFGDFTYSHIPHEAFRLGVTYELSQLMASPLKALFDYIYFYRKSYTSLRELEKDLRIDLGQLRIYVDAERYQDLEDLALSYRKKNCLQFLQVLIRETK
jgi:hypothetical protein